MVKSAKEKELEKQIAEATAKQAGEVAQAQIEVYEGQNFEARQAYEEAKQKRAQARSRLPEKIPDDPEYKERLLQSQYIEARVVSPKQVEQVREYREEIKKQQKAKETVQVLDKEIPQLYTKAVEESKEVEKKAEQAKQAEMKKQEALITSYQKQITEEKQRVQREAQAREDAYKAYMKNAGSGTNKSVSRQIHYGNVGVPLQTGDVILKAGRGTTNVSFHKSYYERAVESYKARGYNVTIADLAKVSATGRRTLSGKARDSAMRAVLDPSGKSEEAYQQSRAQAKRNVASAYASMSAKEKVHSSAMASTYAINHDMSTSEITKRKDAKFDAQMNLVSEMTGGLIGSKKYTVVEGTNTMKVYDKSGTDVTQQVSPIIQKQREIEIANRRQQEYVKELRAGNIGIATALTTPQTTQSYKGTSTVNLKTFLKERGLVAKTAPDSMFKPDYSEKLTEARQRASMSATSGTEMGDLRTQSPMFVGKTDQPYQMRRAGTTELRERELAQERIDVFKPKVIQQQPVKDSIAFKFTNLKDPQVGTLDSGKPLEQKGVSSFGVTPAQSYLDKVYDYTVPSNQKSVFPLMSGQTFQATTPVTFGTQKEAEEYVKSKPKEKVFSGTDNEAWNKIMYAPAVWTGELPDPRETSDWKDDARLTGSTILSPLVSVASSVVNLTQPEDKQIPIYRTGSDVLIGDTIKDFEEGQPLRGTGVTGVVKYYTEEPRKLPELFGEAFMWVGGGWAVSGAVKGAGVGVRVAGQVGSNIVQSSAPRIVTIPTMAVMGAGSAVKTGAQVIQKAPENIWLKGTEASTTLKSIDKSLAYVGGQRVGMGTAMNLRYTWQGRKLLKEAKTTSRQVNQPVPLMEGKIFTMKRIEDPVVIKSKNVIEVPVKDTDESIFHLRNIQQKAKVEKVGNVQQYYRSATPNFINVPRQGLNLPKAPKLPSLNPMRNWITKTQKNVKLVEEKGYGAMLSGGKVKLKAVEKGMKAKDNLLDAEQIAKAEIEAKKREAKLLALGKKYQAEKQMDEMITAGKKKLDPLSEQARQDNAWGKLSQVKAETKVRLSEMKKGITDRPATEELILYREATETTATKSIARSTAEPLTESYTPIKTTVTQTRTPTDFTTGITKDPESLLRGKRFEREEVSMSVGKTQPNLETVGEQVRIPFKDYRAIRAVDQTNLDRLYEQGKYSVYEKGKLVEKKVEVRALQQEDSDKTLIRRNELTGTGEKIQESSVREWGGTRKTLYGDVEVGGQKSDVILKSLSKKVITTKLQPLPKPKKPSVVEQRQTSQTDDTAVWTGSSTSGNPMTGRGTTVPEFTKGKTSTPEPTGTFDPRTGTKTIPKADVISSPVKGKAKEIMKDYSTTWKSNKSPYRSATIGSATVGGITVETVSGLKPSVKTNIDTGVKIDTGIQGKIDTKVDTGLKQDTVQKTLTEQQSRLKSKIKTDTGLKIDTGLKLDTATKQMTATASVPLLQIPLRTQQSRKPKALPIILPRIDLEDRPAKRGKRGKKKGFIGNVRLDNIMGMYKRKEITYGQKKVRKLERLDMKLTTKTPNRISQPSSKLLKSKKKKKPKTETDLLGNVSLKSKSEFKGFTEKKTTKKKSKRKSRKKISLI